MQHKFIIYAVIIYITDWNYTWYGSYYTAQDNTI